MCEIFLALLWLYILDIFFTLHFSLVLVLYKFLCSYLVNYFFQMGLNRHQVGVASPGPSPVNDSADDSDTASAKLLSVKSAIAQSAPDEVGNLPFMGCNDINILKYVIGAQLAILEESARIFGSNTGINVSAFLSGYLGRDKGDIGVYGDLVREIASKCSIGLIWAWVGHYKYKTIFIAKLPIVSQVNFITRCP